MCNNSSCPNCGSSDLAPYRGEGREEVCWSCAHQEIEALLESQDLPKLRRRAEDMLRKNPAALRRALVGMIVEGDLSLTQGGGQ